MVNPPRPSELSWARRYRAKAALLAKRTVLVTGAGAGIGRVVARAFASHGATVVLLGRNIPNLKPSTMTLPQPVTHNPPCIPSI